MKNRTVRFLLSAFQFLIDFSILIFIFAIAIFSLIAVVVLIGQTSDTIDYFGTTNIGFQIMVFIDGLVMAVLAIVMMIGISNIISNINKELYFVVQNLTALRKILWSTTTLFVIQLVNSGLFKLVDIKDVDNFFTFHGNDFEDNLTFIVTIFLIYLVFKRGLTLQKEVDSII